MKTMDQVSESGSESPKPNIIERLLELVRAKCSLFIDSEDKAFASFNSSQNVQQIWPVHSNHFRQLMGSWYYQSYKKPVKNDAKREVCEMLAGFAYEEGRRHEVFLRAATFEGKHYIDLCNDQWQVVEVSENGWQVLDRGPVKFIRSKNMQPLPIPVSGGNIQQLWDFVNVAEQDRLLVLAWLVECLRENTQHPVLEVLGGYATGKSSTVELFRSMVDPNNALLRAMPKKEEDLFISAQSNWILTYENVSTLSDNQQDAMCQISTGSAFAKRTLYSDADETVLQARRPQIINGITPLATRQDLVDRCISIELPTIGPGQRLKKSDLDKAFVEAQPVLFGALLQVMADALKLLPSIQLDELPRMADFGLLGTAIGHVIGHPYSFSQVHHENQKALALSGIESSPAANAILALSRSKGGGLVFEGSYGDLYHQLEPYRLGSESWPKGAKGLSIILKRQIPALALQGVIVSMHGRGSYGMKIRIQYKSCDLPTRPTQPARIDQKADVFHQESVDSVGCVDDFEVESSNQLKQVSI